MIKEKQKHEAPISMVKRGSSKQSSAGFKALKSEASPRGMENLLSKKSGGLSLKDSARSITRTPN